MTVFSYKPVGSTVKAIKFTNPQAEEARAWCSGRIRNVGGSEDLLELLVPTLSGVVEASEDLDYVCWSKQQGFFVMEAGKFETHYERVKTPGRS